MATFTLQVAQYIHISENCSTITFTNDSSHGEFFTMTREQFFDFSDLLSVMKVGRIKGHIPFARNLYFYYDHYSNTAHLYRTWDGRCVNSFTFNTFQEYKRNVHHRILSFLRRRTYGSGRSYRGAEEKSGGEPSNGKRPLSDARYYSTQSTKTIDNHTGETPSRSTDNVIMPHTKEASAILPKRSNTNYGKYECGKIDSIISNDLPPPEEIQLLDGDVSMEVY